MNHNDDEAAELLWKYIEARKQADDAEPFHFVARSTVDPAQVAALLPVADALHSTLSSAGGEDTGRASARQSLEEAIRQPSPRALQPAPRLAWRRETTLLVALLLLGVAVLAVQTYLYRGSNLAAVDFAALRQRPVHLNTATPQPSESKGCGSCHGEDFLKAHAAGVPSSALPTGRKVVP